MLFFMQPFNNNAKDVCIKQCQFLRYAIPIYVFIPNLDRSAKMNLWLFEKCISDCSDCKIGMCTPWWPDEVTPSLNCRFVSVYCPSFADIVLLSNWFCSTKKLRRPEAGSNWKGLRKVFVFLLLLFKCSLHPRAQFYAHKRERSLLLLRRWVILLASKVSRSRTCALNYLWSKWHAYLNVSMWVCLWRGLLMANIVLCNRCWNTCLGKKTSLRKNRTVMTQCWNRWEPCNGPREHLGMK